MKYVVDGQEVIIQIQNQDDDLLDKDVIINKPKDDNSEAA